MTARAEKLFVQSLGRRVRFLRRIRHFSTQELARRAGLAPQTVNSVELAVRVPSVIVVLRLASALQVPWVALLEPAHEQAERMLRDAWAPDGWALLPPPPPADQAEGLPS